MEQLSQYCTEQEKFVKEYGESGWIRIAHLAANALCVDPCKIGVLYKICESELSFDFRK